MAPTTSSTHRLRDRGGDRCSARLTATGHAVGTAAYMAPERFTEDRDADRRVDVYALGCVLHEMLTGSTPFEGTSFPNLMYQHLNAPPPRPSASGELPPGFDEVVATALAKNPDQRYRRAGDLSDAARAALRSAAPRAAAPAPAPPSPRSPPVPMQHLRATRAAPPPTLQAPPGPPIQARWAKSPEAVGPAAAPPAPASPPHAGDAPSGHTKRWIVAGAVTAIVLHALWLTITIFGTVATFGECRVSPLGCVGGVVGLLSAATAALGVVASVAVLRRRERRPGAVSASSG